MKRVLFFLSLAAVGFLAVNTFAGHMPDYHCDEQLSQCERGCDQLAEESRNANAYQECLDRCAKAHRRCQERQDKTTICAEAFMDCIKEAKDNEAAMESCRETYRNCKP
ncbi:MAG: hypothetical protein R2940_14610 [Syntrophotaleaceae bacterium]